LKSFINRRRSGVLLAFVAAAAAAVFVVGASANLAGSTFEGNDGNLVPNGGVDWSSPAPNRAIGDDLPTGGDDNSFGQGDKEDDPEVHVGDGSIPNSKADLSQFYVGSEQAGGHTFLYLGWTRANSGGTTNFDFEINQAEQPDLTTLGVKTLNRTNGDLLVNYLFQGQGTPQIAIRTWNGSSWSAPQDASAYSEAAINSGGAVPNPLPGAINPTPQNRFGEAAIDLTAGGQIPPGVCRAFGSVFVKTRSSTSFTSEIKDFIAPIHVNIANCATIIVEKVTVPSPDPTDTSFAFVSDFDGNFSLKNGESHTKADLNPGTYSVSETVPANWSLTSFTCSDGSLPSAIDLGPSETVTCTATNTLLLGAIKVSKTSVKGGAPLAGAVFSVSGQSNLTTGADGTACVDGLIFGDYLVTEVSAPGGYAIDDPAARTVNVNNSADCDDAVFGGELSSFSDTPLTDITATANSQDDGPGGTLTTITCVNSLGENVGNSPSQNIHDPSVAANNLRPGTYTCTLVIDP
jgi:hypothetical protein